MSNRTTWIVALVSVAVVAVALVAWRAWGPSGSSTTPGGNGFSVDGIALESRDIAVDLVDLKALANPEYTEWSCFFVCRENDGCHVDVRLEILYRSGGEERKINIAGRFDADDGERMRIGRVQRPPIEIGRIDRLTVVVEGEIVPVEMVPTPMM